MRYLNQMMRFCLFSLFIFLTGCNAFFGDHGWFRDRSLDYQTAQTLPPMKVTDDSGRPVEFQADYPIPSALPANTTSFKMTHDQTVPTPPVFIRLDEQAGLFLSRNQQQEWLFISQPKAVVWQKLETFWQQHQMILAVDDSSKGVMETSWLLDNPFRSSPGFWASLTHKQKPVRFKFRVQMSTDQEARTGILLSYAEIPVAVYAKSPRDFSHLLPQDALWQNISEPDSTRGRALAALMDVFKMKEAAATPDKVRFKPQRIQLTQDGNGYTVLEIEQDFALAWANLGGALQKAQIPVDDLNRALGIYYIHYGKQDKKPVTYELKVTRAEKDVHVTLQVNDNTLAPAEITQLLLTQLKQALETL